MKDNNGFGSDTILDEEIEANLLEAFQVGAVVADAAAYAKIGKRTLDRWMQWGRDPQGPKQFRELVAKIEQAKGHGNVVSLAVMATSEDWRAHRARLAMQRAEYAERRFVHGEVTHRHEFDFSRLEHGELEVLRGLLAKAQLDGAPVLELEPVAEEDGALHENGSSVT